MKYLNRKHWLSCKTVFLIFLYIEYNTYNSNSKLSSNNMFRPTWVIIRVFRDVITFNLFVYSTYTVVVCLLGVCVGLCCLFKGSEIWWLAF